MCVRDVCVCVRVCASASMSHGPAHHRQTFSELAKKPRSQEEPTNQPASQPASLAIEPVSLITIAHTRTRTQTQSSQPNVQRTTENAWQWKTIQIINL